MSSLFGLARSVLFQMDAETAHGMVLKSLKTGLGGKDRGAPDPMLMQTVFGLTFPNPVGLAAGFDKNAEVPDALLRLGFGHVECGTITPRPQVGNPKPRIFRLVEDRAVINRLGFNNEGLEAAAARLEARHRAGAGGIVGANLGANKDTQDKPADYVTGLKRLYGLADYFTVNVSSPNTPGLRNLQQRDDLQDLLTRVLDARAALAGTKTPKPVLLKVAPDLTPEDVADIVDVAVGCGVDGLIVSNTTIARPEGLKGASASETGGLSGAPLFERSTDMIRTFAGQVKGRIPIIGVGGVASPEQAYAKIRAGASLVQLYTGLVYEGPGLVEIIVNGLPGLLKADGFASVSEAVGADLH